MFKFSKIVVLFIMIIGLVACSSVPTNVSKSVYNDISKIQGMIDDCFNNEKCDYTKTNELVNNSLTSIKPQTEEEYSMKMASLDLLLSLISYKTEFNEQEIIQLDLEFKKLHNEISDQLNKKKQYLN